MSSLSGCVSAVISAVPASTLLILSVRLAVTELVFRISQQILLIHLSMLCRISAPVEHEVAFNARSSWASSSSWVSGMERNISKSELHDMADDDDVVGRQVFGKHTPCCILITLFAGFS